MLGQLKVTAELYIIYVRSAAEIGEVALLIASNIAIFQVRNQIQLVFVVLEHLHGLFLGNLLADDLLAGFGHLLHLFLDRGNVLVTDDVVAQINIIIEALRYNRSYPELRLRIQVAGSPEPSDGHRNDSARLTAHLL